MYSKIFYRDNSCADRLQIRYGTSVHSWPSGHALDSEEAIQFAELQDIKCMVETYPLEKANEAYGKISTHCPLLQSATNAFIDAMLKGSVRFRSVIKMN